MAALKLKELLRELDVIQGHFAKKINIGTAAFNQLVNQGKWPKKMSAKFLADDILSQLKIAGATELQLDDVFKQVDAECDNTQHLLQTKKTTKELQDMLLRKQTLSQKTRKTLSLFTDPFRSDDVTDQDDVFLTPSVRYVREALYQTARLGGFVAVIGESGSGKSTLRKDLITRLDKENQSVTTIEPFVLGMEDNDKSGKTLKSAQIAEAIITAIDPISKPRMGAEARFRQMHSLLLESSKAGNKHCLIIEEAHGLSIPTLKHLKRFYELEHGFTKMLSIVLIGQPELHHKLSEKNPSVREVVQRCEVVTLEPLDHYVTDYLQFKFNRANASCDSVFDDNAFDAIKNKLTLTGQNRQRHSLLYPLAINNLAVAAMNLAAELGESKVTADVVAEVN